MDVAKHISGLVKAIYSTRTLLWPVLKYLLIYIGYNLLVFTKHIKWRLSFQKQQNLKYRNQLDLISMQIIQTAIP